LVTRSPPRLMFLSVCRDSFTVVSKLLLFYLPPPIRAPSFWYERGFSGRVVWAPKSRAATGSSQ
jgi:hypothetical protein